MAESADAVLSFLRDPRAFGERPGREVAEIVTHSARVFLCGDTALKIKRPVKLSFLDFSSLAQRRAALAAELRLNRRTAPSLYREVRAIVADARNAPGWAAETPTDAPADGELERCLVMQRFAESLRLDRLLEGGQLDTDTVLDLAERVAGLHRAAEPAPWAGGSAGLAEVIDGNDDSLRGYSDLLGGDRLRRLAALSRDALSRRAERLEARRDGGLARRGHGDLHLGNICRLDGAATPFDCLEFDDRLATTDVLYDLAFLLMDLGARGAAGLANRCLNRYRDIAPELCPAADLGLLPLFQACRAAVRAKVLATQTADAGAEERERLAATARSHLDWATGLLQPPPPRLIAVGGVSGTGKSSLAYALAPLLAPAPGAVVLRSDMERKTLLGAAWDERLPETGYRRAVTNRVHDRLLQLAEDALASGQPAIVDAVQGNARFRQDLEAVAARQGVAFDGLWLSAPPRALLDRVSQRSGDVSDADAAIVKRQLAQDSPPADWHRIDAGGSRTATVDAARAALAL